MGQKKKGSVFTTFQRGMYKDSLSSTQPEGTYKEAWNAIHEADEENGGFITNEPSNELWVNMPAGEIRGRYFVEERDSWVVLILLEGGGEEIGVVNSRTREYTTICQGDLGGLTQCEWVPMTGKILQPCNQLHVYWTVQHEYYFLNIDDPCLDCDDFRLFKCVCIPSLETVEIEGSGQGGLPNGKYWFAVRLIDEDGNTTNWFHVSKGVNIGEEEGGDNIPGELSGKVINIRLDALNKRYGRADIAVISKIDGVISSYIVDTVSYGENQMDYTFRGRDSGAGEPIPIEPGEILARADQYVRGDNLEQYDGHLLLYELQSQFNIDYQRRANEIDARYVVYAVPLSEAHKHSGLRPNENYWFGIRWNYCDGTSSATFAIPGRDPGGFGTAQVCEDGCEVPIWEVEDTSERTHLFCDSLTPQVSNGEFRTVGFVDNDPELVPDFEIEDRGSGSRDSGSGGGGSRNVIDDITEQITPEDLAEFEENFSNELAVEYLPGHDFESTKCACDELLEVLRDTKEVLDREDCPDCMPGGAVEWGGEKLHRLLAFEGINVKDIYTMACACDSLREDCNPLPEDPPCAQVYGEGSTIFKDLVKELII